MLNERRCETPIPSFAMKAPTEDLPYRAVFYPLGFAIEILTNDRAVLQAAAETWGHLLPRRMDRTIRVLYAVHGSPDDECPPYPTPAMNGNFLSLIADRNNHALCDFDAGLGFATISRAALNNRLYFRYHFLESLPLVLLSSLHAPALHAACVSRHGQGLLLCGPTGAGKSTLAYASARAGFTFTSDDASYLLMESLDGLVAPRVTGHSHKIRLRLHARELFPELRPHEITPRLEGKPSIEVPTSELAGILTAQEAPIHHLILLKRAETARAQLVPISTPDALSTFESGIYPTGEVRRRHLAALHSLTGLRAYEFHYWALDEATHALDQLTRGAIA